MNDVGGENMVWTLQKLRHFSVNFDGNYYFLIFRNLRKWIGDSSLKIWIKNKENLENPVVVLEEALTEKVEKLEDKQEENTSQSEEAVVENNEDNNQAKEDGIQLKESDTEICQSQSEEKRTRKTSSRKKGK